MPRLRRKRRVDVPRLLGRVFDGIAEIDGQTERYHQRWDTQNEAALTAKGPLWVALGDSSTQGVGASTWENAWVLTVLDRLRSTTGEPWRLINLSMSGGRFADVADRQMSVLNTMLPEPALVTCVVGSNDLMWRRGTTPVYRDAQQMVDRLPPAAVLSRLNGPGPRRGRLNEIFDQGERDRALRLFNIWDWPTGRNALAADYMHPSDLGYEFMADLAWATIAEHVVGRPSRDT